ncbi:hypothetical protein CCO03_11170 [Comamonas serinivorans]|uniref:TonB-dependent receptor-like beta-barrel domain-containing protein n=2 Tax=Comamonas serinivorans TaxID=1082851 RepID=A0A1Y0ENK2_9BURK|nr:hypothetical protein CCO03_11170 [Comamonas serinivorans]
MQWQNRLCNTDTTAGVAWRNQQGAHAMADLIVGYRLAPGAGIQLNISNLFDKVYRAIGHSTEWARMSTASHVPSKSRPDTPSDVV